MLDKSRASWQMVEEIVSSAYDMSSTPSMRGPVIAAVLAGGVAGVWLANRDTPPPMPESVVSEPVAAVAQKPPEPIAPVAVPAPTRAPLPPPAAAPPPRAPEPMAPPPEPEPDPLDTYDAGPETPTGPLEGDVREHAILITLATSKHAMEKGDLRSLNMVKQFLEQPQAEGIIDESEARAVNVAIDCIEQADGALDTAQAFLREDNASTLKESLQGLCFPDGLPEPEPALDPDPAAAEGESAPEVEQEPAVE